MRTGLHTFALYIYESVVSRILAEIVKALKGKMKAKKEKHYAVSSVILDYMPGNAPCLFFPPTNLHLGRWSFPSVEWYYHRFLLESSYWWRKKLLSTDIQPSTWNLIAFFSIVTDHQSRVSFYRFGPVRLLRFCRNAWLAGIWKA